MIEREQLEYDSTEEASANLESIFDEAIQTIVKREPFPRVEAVFFPYAGLSSTIRLRQGRVYARVSDILAHSPREVLYALASILVSKLYRRKPPKQHQQTYREYVAREATLTASEAARRNRGYKITTSPRGKVYDLEALFADLNARYFEDNLARPLLSWSQRRTSRVLGHHDHIHGTIIISRTLDSPRIPRFVIEYVLYHEMLHVKHPPRRALGRTIYHGRQFQLDERAFERYHEAVEFLDRIAPPARRKRPRKARKLAPKAS